MNALERKQAIEDALEVFGSLPFDQASDTTDSELSTWLSIKSQ